MPVARLLPLLMAAGCVVPGLDFDAFEIACTEGSDCPAGYVCPVDTCVPEDGVDVPDPDAGIEVGVAAGLWHFWAKDSAEPGEPWLAKGSFSLNGRGAAAAGEGTLFVFVTNQWQPMAEINGGSIRISDSQRGSFEGSLLYLLVDTPATLAGTLSADGGHMTGTFISPVGPGGPFDALKMLPGAGLTCHPEYIRAEDGCDCGCSSNDPDCGGDGCTVPGCRADACQMCYGEDHVAVSCE